LYPPGRVPGGVTVHVNDEDGDVDIETPTSLQAMYLIFYFFSHFFKILYIKFKIDVPFAVVA
jgi:hypothetical protein